MLIVLARDEQFLISLENDPKGGPLDGFLYIFCALNLMIFLVFCFSITFSPLTRNIQPFKLNIFEYTDTMGVVYVLHHPYQHSALTQLVVVICFVAKLSSSKQLKFQLNWYSIITTCLPPDPTPPSHPTPPNPTRNSSNLHYHWTIIYYKIIQVVLSPLKSPLNEEDPKNADNLKNEDDLRNKDDLKKEHRGVQKLARAISYS